jgi:hypothetical protein
MMQNNVADRGVAMTMSFSTAVAIVQMRMFRARFIEKSCVARRKADGLPRIM